MVAVFAAVCLSYAATGPETAVAADMTAEQVQDGPAASKITAPATPDPQKIAIIEQFYVNIGIVDALTVGFKRVLRENPQFSVLTAAQSAKFVDIFAANVESGKPAMFRKLALARDSGTYSMAQLNVLLELSQIKLLRQVLMYGTDSTLARPDPATLTPTEKALLESINRQPSLEAFLKESQNIDAIRDDVADIYHQTLDQFSTWQQSQPASEQ